MAAPRKYDEATRKRILELHVHEQRSASETAKILERDGTPISIHTVRSIAKEEARDDITNRPKAEQLRHLIAGLVTVTNAEITRINGTKEPADADQLLKLARTIREIEPLLTDKPRGKANKEPSTLVGRLSDSRPQQHATNQSNGSGAPVTAHVGLNGGVQ